jgi:amino acid transporter
MVIFVAYEGVELIANAAEDIKKAKSNLPKHFMVRLYWLLFSTFLLQ